VPYPEVSPKADYPGLERAILQRWKADGTFEASIEQRPAWNADGGDEFVFFDGPPFANGLPHYGHILTSYVKDVVPRFQTMRGRRVERRFGWDCHGLPAEMEAEKQLDIHGRAAITEFGIDNFNDHCRTSVLQYTSEWESYVTRMARWVDFDHDYKTMDTDYMESVMWAFKQLWDKGLIYEEYRVMPYSWGAQTPLSNFEIRLDDATRPRQDPALTVLFDLEPVEGDPGRMRIAAWTTTPWTLPSNLALAVGPDVDYAILHDASDASFLVIGNDVRDKYAKQLEGLTEVEVVKGSTLIGRRFTPLFGFFADADRFPDTVANGFRILAGDFVDTSEGTGVVHMAPAFGEDDQRVCADNGIAIPGMPVDDEGNFNELVPDWQGLNVFDANAEIIKALKQRGVVVRHDTYEHNYPHCWRTDTPIIYRALSSWYVRVTDLTERMLELNQQITWIPGHVQSGAFGKWLEGARDWSISRDRFWGSPIPVWVSDNPDFPRMDVYGSIEELQADFGVEVTDLHRPFIDTLVRANPDDPSGQSMMRRVPQVLDCWFESGSMPFAQAHYPFENAEHFEATFPADFIVEYIAQSRGWFYTLHVLATALFDKPAFTSAICHGVVLDSEGRKLSKRLRNYPDPEQVFETIGSDALRWFLMSSPILRGLDLRIARDDSQMAEVVRQVLNPLWSAYYFFTLYANVDGVTAQRRTDSTDLLDRYVLAKLREVVEGVTEALDTYDLAGATEVFLGFIDALNNWYIRRSRDRFWSPEGEQDQAGKQAAYDTLWTVLTTLSQVAAPLLPFIAEEMFTNLTGERSVHLTNWPDANELPADHELVAAMDKAREVVTAALSLREAEGLRVRLPLNKVTIASHQADALRPYAALIRDEVNVKVVEFSDDVEAYGSFVLRPNGRAIGPRLGGDTQTVIKAAKAGDWTRRDDGIVEVAGFTLEPGEYDLALQAPEGLASTALRGNDAVVALDLEVTKDLEDEGFVRDLIRAVQQARKDADLSVADRIRLSIHAPGPTGDVIRAFESMLADAVLAREVVYSDEPIAAHLVHYGEDGMGFDLAAI